MSVSDPLLKELKGKILRFLQYIDQDSNWVTDRNSDLSELCLSIEQIFACGFEYTNHSFSLMKVNYPWFWLDKIVSTKHVSLSFNYINAVEYVRKNQHFLTNLGRLRLLIRCCLKMKVIHIPVEYLIRSKQLRTFYKEYSILGNEILSEILLSLLLQCSKMNFKLDLTNISFLSATWMLPEIVAIELVPCASIGISISFVGDQAVIVDVQSGSVVSETGKVDVGDILDNLNSVRICSATKGKLSSILKNNKGKPVEIKILKAKYSDTNELFGPIIQLLKKVKPALLSAKSHKISSDHKKTGSAGFKATYVGSVCTGPVGDINQIDSAVRLLLTPFNGYKNHLNSKYVTIKKVVQFEIGELGIKVIDLYSLEIILKHSFMEISSCGSITHLPNYFGYIAGNDYCNSATQFTCYVFHVKNVDSIYTILESLGQGFHRTHFVV